MKKLLWFLILTLDLGPCLPAGEAGTLDLRASGAGTSSADFLNIGLGARATAMGGSFVGLADDASAIYWNPAGLSQLLEQEVGFLHAQWLSGINYEYGFYAAPHPGWGTWAASVTLLHKNDIPGFDETGGSLGEVSVKNQVATLGWGSSLFVEGLSLGGSVKWIQENLAGYSANSYAADLGALYSLTENPFYKVQAGLSLRHLGNHGNFVSGSESLPRTLAVGVGFKGWDQRLSVGLDGVFPKDAGLGFFTIGSEYWVHPVVAIRSGYRWNADIGTGFSAGAGFRVGAFQFDYTVSDFGALGLTHRGGISYRFGGAMGRYYREGLALMRQESYAEAFLKFNNILSLDPGNKRAILRMKECQTHIQKELKEGGVPLKP
ncbi:MAG: PorV/PorQ family protein [Elusimicrobia bacterium]|nr:PorV/PorQ family protein [Elusimicrobiota bacterium]